MADLSAFADEYSHNLESQVDLLHTNHLEYLEIRFINQKNVCFLSIEEVKKIKAYLDDNNIKISAIGTPIGKVALDQPWEKHLDLFKNSVEIAKILNTDKLRIFSYYGTEDLPIDAQREIVLERMQDKLDLIKGENICLLHENEDGIYGHSARNCADLARTINSDQFRLVYDPGNFVWGEGIVNNIDTCWPVMKEWVRHIHIKDWKLGSKEVGSLPGSGDAQIEELLHELSLMDYEGLVTMEPHLDAAGQFGGSTTYENYKKSIELVRSMSIKTGLKLK